MGQRVNGKQYLQDFLGERHRKGITRRKEGKKARKKGRKRERWQERRDRKREIGK